MAAVPAWGSKSLLQLGYNHIGLDDCWQVRARHPFRSCYLLFAAPSSRRPHAGRCACSSLRIISAVSCKKNIPTEHRRG